MVNLIKTAYEELQNKYGSSYIYSGASLRISREEEYIKDYHSVYEAAYYVIDWCNSERLMTFTRGTLGNSFIAYLNGMTKINPLIPHYNCPNCDYCELIPPSRVKDGFDLPDKVCPKCGRKIFGDGHNLPYEINEKRHSDININVSKVRFEEIKELIDCMGYYIETMDEYVFKIFPREELIDEYITVNGNDWCDKYSQMMVKTNYQPNDFPESDAQVIQKDNLIADILGFSDDERFLRLQEIIRPTKFSDYTRILGLLFGTEVYDNYESFHLNSIFYNKDDMYLALENVHEEEKIAKKLHPEAKDIDLFSFLLSKDQINQIEKRIHLFPKAHLVSYMAIAMRLAWYKDKFPKEYEEVCDGIK